MKNKSILFKHILGLVFPLMLIVQAISIEVGAQTTPAEARVKIVNGYTQLFINGNSVVPVMPFVNTDIDQSREVNIRQLKLAADKGDIHLHMVIVTLPLPDAQGEFDLTRLKKSIDLVRTADSNGYLILRLALAEYYNPSLYKESERIKFANGTVSDWISMASDKWLEYAAKELKAIIKCVLSNPDYARMVVGYQLTAGETGEWFQFSYRENGVDVSEANTRKFREWLAVKYNNIDELNRSWDTTDVNFESALIPSDYLGEVLQPNPRTLYDKKSDQRVLDYLDYYNEMTSDRIVYLAKVVKEATDRKSLVGAFYGYTFELADAKSGHYDLKTVLESADVDFLDAPVSYNNRNEGGIGASMSLVESIHAHGKMWFDECDYRSPIITFDPGHDKDPVPSIKTFEGLVEVYRRQMGFQMLKGNGGWAMDLSGKGWYDDAGFWKEMKSLKEIYSRYEKIRPVSAPEVALIVDEEGLALAADVQFNVQMLLFLRDELYKTGVNFGIYLRSDLEKGLVPSAKLYIMVGAFRLSSASIKNLAEELHQSGKTVVWMYGFGTTSPSGIQSLTGMQINDSGESSVPGIIPSIALNTLLPEIGSLPFGLGVKESPIWAVQNPDSGITSLGITWGGTTSGRITFAKCIVNGSNQIFYGSNVLKADMLRALARFAGANIFNEGGWDACMANTNLVVLHTSTAGKRTICFPRKIDAYEQYTGKWYSDVDRIELTVPAAKTYVFYYGNKSVLQKAGIDSSSVRNTDPIPLNFTAYPNPVKNTLFIKIDAEKTENAEVSITDNNGRKVYSSQVNLSQGNNNFSVDVNKLSQGFYCIKIQLRNGSSIKKFIKLY